MSSTQYIPSPGNIGYAPGKTYEIRKPHGTGISRSVAHILSGTVKGPGINGKLINGSGADWAQLVHSDKIFYRLDAHYAIVTDDGYHVFIQTKGVFRPGPVGFKYIEVVTKTISQDDVEFFSHITLEDGEGPYNWMALLLWDA